ncbi:MAG: TusE/DsrC/DsvC family sulfur relay protein [Sandaracinus sp.]
MMERTTSPVTLEALASRIDALTAQVGYLVERQRKTEELFAEATPILREVMGTATRELESYEQKGYFAFGRELVRVGERIAEGFTPEDVRQLGTAVVGILETVRAMTQPEVLRVASDAAAVVQNAESAEPIGLVGMVRATSDHEVQRGMAVMMEVMRHVGRASKIVSAERAARPLAQKRAKLDAALGARKRALGVERTRPAATPPPVPADARKHHAPAPPACSTPAGPPPPVATIDGIAFGADGHMSVPEQWTREVGAKIAAMQGVEMSDAHWKVIDAARADYAATKASPNIRRLTQLMGVTTKDFYVLFPKAPGRTIAKIAGLPKPAGCL